ncbi:plastocyanin/azurin family copper-binding protein [Aquihabitans daechungensis]|uniref:cupredoxin domain-containing protein n=1 Tax=Aquihabitans daechungensis TaxID=1052257 RepID=UPI003BA0050E
MRIRALLMIAAATAATAGCGNGDPAIPMTQAATATTAPAGEATGPDLSAETFTDLTGESTVDVQARDNSFVEPYIEVSAGTQVDFTNKGRNQHNVIPTTDGAFAEIPVEDFQPKDEGSITFALPGDYTYYCSLHGTPTKGMIGAIRVLQ